MKKSFYTLLAFSLFTAGIFFISCKPEIHEHTYSDQWTVDEEYHWHEATCEHTTEIKGKSAHIWDDGTVTKEATEAAEGEKTYTCTICKTTKTEVIAKLSHTHKYSTEWTSDATQHWHVCSGCEEKGDLANHEWDEGKETSKTEITYTCTVCGATYTDSTKNNEEESKYPNDVNETYNKSVSKSLDFIFNTETIGKTTLTIKRSEWNQLLKNYDYFYKNENLVLADTYEYEKGGKTWKLQTVGIRLRGNTSRFRPQGKDYPNDSLGNHKPNADWMQSYYNYAASCSDNDYRQSHFKIDFEPLDDDDRKMSNCMKGVALKRMDGSCTKEIFCYDLFHRYGIWTAPRASHTRVIINFIEEDGSTTKIDFGVYEMFEEVNKTSLKARDKDENKATNAWKNSKGNLWKCAGGDLSDPDATMFAEDIRITDFDENGNPLAYVWNRPTYDIKTNKKELDSAASELKQFITELNALPDVSSESDTTSINAIKAFYEKWMDVDFFLKTYAVNILVGMDDDYWANKNNYYLYFTDTPNNGRKVYFIPFDYDNTLGASIKGDADKGEPVGIEQNPLEWGRGANRPLMDKLLQVPEYKQLFINKLKEVSSSDSEWNYEKCSQRWYTYWNMVEPYLNSPYLDNYISTKSHWDNTYKPAKSLVNRSNNLYDYTRACFMSHIRSSGEKLTFDLNGGNIDGSTNSVSIDFPTSVVSLGSLIISPKKTGYVFMGWTKTKDGYDYQSNANESTVYASWKKLSDITDLFIYELEEGMDGYDASYEGIQIGIINPPSLYDANTNPSGARCRQIYVNGRKIGDISNSNKVTATKWAFPYTEENQGYTIYIKYLKSDYSTQHSISNEITIKAKSGKGKYSIENSPIAISVTSDNVITFSPQPEIYVAGQKIDSTYNPGFYEIVFRDSGWNWSDYKYVYDYKVDSFNVLNAISTKNTSKALGNKVEVDIRYIVGNSNFGDYRQDISISDNKFNCSSIDNRPKATVITDSGLNGLMISLPVSQLSSDISIRRIRIDGNLVSDIRSYTTTEAAIVKSDKWYTPFVTPGKQYTVSVEYRDEDWEPLITLPDLIVTPTSGEGEIKIIQQPAYKVTNNVLTWTTQPKLSYGSTEITTELFESTSNIGYKITLNTTSWDWCCDKTVNTHEIESFNLKEYCSTNNSDNLNKALSNTCFIALDFVWGSNFDTANYPYGRYNYEILNNPSKMNFNLQ